MEYLRILILIFLNDFFAICEIAPLSSKKAKIKVLVKTDENRASIPLELMGKLEKFRAAIQVTMTMIGDFAGTYRGISIAEKLAPFVELFTSLMSFACKISLALIVSAITFLSIIIGHLVPKTFALTNPGKIAITISPVIISTVFVIIRSPDTFIK